MTSVYLCEYFNTNQPLWQMKLAYGGFADPVPGDLCFLSPGERF
jgi:hypothetical protein